MHATTRVRVMLLAFALGCVLPGVAMAGNAAPPLLASHREMPGQWQATEVASGLTTGPDGMIYFVTASPRATARFARFDPATQQFEQLADLGRLAAAVKAEREMQVRAPVVFDRHGDAWLGTTTVPHADGERSAWLLAYSLRQRDFQAAVELRGYAVAGLASDRARDLLLVLASNARETRFMRYSLRTKTWKDGGVVSSSPSDAVKMVLLNDGSAVIFVGSSAVFRYDVWTKKLVRTPQPFSALGAVADTETGVVALAPSPDGRKVYGVTGPSGVLFAYDVKKRALRNLGPAFGDDAVPGEPTAGGDRMALVIGADGTVQYAGFANNQGLVAAYNPLRDKRATIGALASPARVMAATMAGAACLGRDKRVYLAGFGWTGCGLYAYPPLPAREPWSTTDRTYACLHIDDTALTLDGDLSDPIWQAMPPLTDFVTAGPNPQPAQHASVARVAWSNTRLYFAFHCTTNGFKSAGTDRDDDIWNAECAELFVCPNGADAPYYEIDANPEGVIYDSRVQSYSYLEMEKQYKEWAKSWNGMVANTRVERDAAGQVTGWTLEAAVPFNAFDGGAPLPGDEWLFLPIRIAMSPEGKGEWSCWHPTYADFHRPHQFPKLRFVKE